ncbi:DUF6308 family protein [Thermoproteota archaeon]
MGIRLRDDIYFSDPEVRIREYCEIEVYYGYDDQHTLDNNITQIDIDTANKLYAMIGHYDKTEKMRLINQAQIITPLLAAIPQKAIHDYNDNEWMKLKPKLEKLLRKMISIHGIGIAKSTKILHLKRPKLFPVLDSYLVQLLTNKLFTSSHRDIVLAMNTLEISRGLIKSQILEFTKLQTIISDLPIPLTIARLFDILCWSTYKWDILKKTSAPKGTASKSLLDYKRPKRSTSEIRNVRYASKQVKKTRPTAKSGAKSIVIDFFDELSNRAHYGVHGEKPIAVLAILKYLHETKQVGIRFLDLIDFPYYEKVRKTFIEAAEQFGKMKNPSSSWSVITGRNRELQIAVQDNG